MDSIDSKKIGIDRIEDKYIVPRDHYDTVKQCVEANLKPHYPSEGTQYTLIRSIYFDSPDLTFLKQHLNKIEDRRKIRIRSYAPNGVWGNEHFAEVKYKSNGLTKKHRLRVNEAQIQSLIKNQQIDIDNELQVNNPDLSKDELEVKAKLFNYLLKINNAKPVVAITYKRFSYIDDEATIKITIDQDVKCAPVELIKLPHITDLLNQDLWKELQKVGERFSNKEDFLLEVKHLDHTPDWVDNMIKDLKLDETAFSKYAWACYQIIKHLMRMSGR
jgi:SPX domain protein involved in polyphosphate accumulation